ncbi:NHLP family bacteriocin export ABC transporter peptidase/permease/ATPase subunit [Streptomyces luomodiensis]|uniref:NHLP family bacteriocin export ABC transporter peptidase/permease/ATPase subunit n=1 Tax=Streptomyces luomodiensis TaxID=3026192 RepID=A0ABY9URN3_9ACTN|nr:NHLP family bacteriocin export ABC transporter peptidase/permease/ATPase subunit [Streptomyces sp. SCA4-21]WNE95207.1 NHLP family bacteriocin export ABC transporter peptidase/permease/ATPase subunit [Streptomyces sp. SCA4-21]
MTTRSVPPQHTPGRKADSEAAGEQPHHGMRRGRREGRSRKRMRVRTPTVIQLEAVECGAASLSMVLGHFGRFVPLEELRTACGVSRDGAKASNLLRAARSYGLLARGRQMEVEKLRTLRPPTILFWNFNHFVVYEGMGTRLGRPVVHLNDPASGKRTVSLEEFDNSFTGIVLTFERGPDFQRGGRPPRILSDLYARYSSNGGALLLALLASILLIIPGVAVPAFTRAFIDRVLNNGDHSFITPLIGAMGVAAGLTVVLTLLQQAHLLRVESSTAIRSSARVVRHLLRLPVVFFTQRNPAEISQRVASNDRVAEILSRDVATAAVSALLVVFYAILLWTYDAELTVIGVGVALLNIVVLRLVSRLRSDAVTKLRADRARLTAASFNGLQLIETMKASGTENDYFGRWAGFQAKVVSGSQVLGTPTALLAVVPPLLAAVDSGCILLIGGLKAIDGAISIGLLVAFQTLVTNFSRPVSQLTNLGPRVQDVAADINRLKDIERFPLAADFGAVTPGSGPAGAPKVGPGRAPAPQDPPRRQAPDRPAPSPSAASRRPTSVASVELRGITFGYSPLGDPLLRDFDLSVRPGQRVALVGGSGSGKSTVSRLIAGLYEPWSGQILFDGRERREYARDTLGSAVAFVDQDIFLFEGTVRENVTLWDTSIPDDRIVAALRAAAVYDVVASRPGTLGSFVAEGGSNFSGGQRQRLEIARALVRGPSVMVLDEATSALDAETEKRIDDNLRRLGCACVIIAHRLSTIRDSDEILVLDHGRVVQRGTHHTLVGAEGLYADLIREQ